MKFRCYYQRHKYVCNSTSFWNIKHQTYKIIKRTFDLFTSSIVNGKLITAPEVRLLPYTQTTFTLESNFGVNDRIEYDWGYLPEDVWCTNNTAPITGSYKYEYGSNSCDSDSITCYDTAETLSSSYQVKKINIHNYYNQTDNKIRIVMEFGITRTQPSTFTSLIKINFSFTAPFRKKI